MKKWKSKLLTAIVFVIVGLVVMSQKEKTAPIAADSSFYIQFIDVGQGDSALIQCDGQFMLIDGGDTYAAEKVSYVLAQNDVYHLDYLVISHLHKDHYGGLVDGLTYPKTIGTVLCNETEAEAKTFGYLEENLSKQGLSISVPRQGDTFALGSAQIEVIDATVEESNDSLVLLVTYGENTFLFTGDIEESAQTRISDRYENALDMPYKIDLIKMPHHGSYTGTLYRFLRTFMPDHTVISAGEDNSYGHPHDRTLELLTGKEWKPNIYRTDLDGDIIVTSDGKTITVQTTG